MTLIPIPTGYTDLEVSRTKALSGGWVSRNDLGAYLTGKISLDELLKRTVSGGFAAWTDQVDG